MKSESDPEDDRNIPAHEAVARLESRIEELADGLERCRKINLFSKALMIGGALWLASGLLGFVYLGSATLGAIAAILGGIVLNGSNRSTTQQIQAAIDGAEAQRVELIGAINLRTVEDTGSSGPVRWLH